MQSLVSVYAEIVYSIHAEIVYVIHKIFDLDRKAKVDNSGPAKSREGTKLFMALAFG